MGSDVQLVMQCPQCQTKITNPSWLTQTCPNCGFASGSWLQPENNDHRKQLLGLLFLQQAYDLSGRNRNQQALSAAHQALQYASHKSEVLNLLGIIYQKMGKREEAQQAFSQALALSTNYEPALQNLSNVTKANSSEPKPSALKSLREIRAKLATKTGQTKKQQVELFVFLIVSYLCSQIFPTLYEVIWPLITGFGVIVIGYIVVSYLLSNKLSDSARPGTIVIGLLIMQLFRLTINLWLDELSIMPLLDLFMILGSVTIILWLIFRPDLSAYLASIVWAVSVFFYQTAFLFILFRSLGVYSFNWLLDLGLAMAIVYSSLASYKQYDMTLVNRRQVEIATLAKAPPKI